MSPFFVIAIVGAVVVAYLIGRVDRSIDRNLLKMDLKGWKIRAEMAERRAGSTAVNVPSIRIPDVGGTNVGSFTFTRIKTTKTTKKTATRGRRPKAKAGQKKGKT